MARWQEPTHPEIPESLAELVGGHPLVLQSLVRRGFQDAVSIRGYLDPDHYHPADPLELPGMDQAADCVQQSIQSGHKILVWGDFDVDGQTATALLVSTLRRLQANVSYHIPVRQFESHGISERKLAQILDHDPSIGLVLTCDTGISAHRAAQLADSRGVKMVVTDHHTLPADLPVANAIVNPHLLSAGHPLSTLPGVGVAYMLSQELFRRVGEPQACQDYLDLVAVGIVADLAEIRADSRFLLQLGLRALRDPARLGVQVLLELAGIEPGALGEEHIGFLIAPRLNAIGRLGDANPVIELLTSQDEGLVRLIAEQVEAHNARRQLLTSQVTQAALKQVKENRHQLDEPVMVLAHPTWPAGVIGIVASRLVDRFGKPVVLVTTPAGEHARASARSVHGVDITAALEACSDLLVSYGGHAMAAGFSLEPEKLPLLKRRLNQSVLSAGGIPEQILQLDGYLQLSELSPELVVDLERLRPFGPGNPQVLLASRQMRVAGYLAVGRQQEHLQVSVEDEWGESFRLMWWQAADLVNGSLFPQGLFDLAYTVRSSKERGRMGIQIEWVDYRPDAQSTVVLNRSPIQITDYRQQPDPFPVLLRLLAQPGVQVWAEGAQRDGLKLQLGEQLAGAIHHRNDLEKAQVLVIWTTPPGQAELQQILERVSPREVVIFAQDPQESSYQRFLERLAGLAKFVLKSLSGNVQLVELAAASAARENTVLAGLETLQAMGLLGIKQLVNGKLLLEAGNALPISDTNPLATRLRASLAETSAYREFFRLSDSSQLGLDSV